MEQRQLVLDDRPYEGIIHEVISVNQQVSKGDDLLMVADSARRLGVVLRNTSERLSDDLEVPLDRVTEKPVLEVTRFAPAVGGFEDEPAARRMSSRYLGVLGRIEDGAALVHGTDEVRVLESAQHHQINATAQQLPEVLPKSEVAMEQVGAGFRSELHEEVEVAVPRFELTAGGGPEDLEACDAVVLAKPLDGWPIPLDQGNHG